MILYCPRCRENQVVVQRYVACKYCGVRDGRGLTAKPMATQTGLLKPRIVRTRATRRQLIMLRGAKKEGVPLSIWLARRGSTKLGFARETGVTRQTVDNWLKTGKAWPRHADKIYGLMVAEGIRPALLNRSAERLWEVYRAAESENDLP